MELYILLALPFAIFTLLLILCINNGDSETKPDLTSDSIS